MKKRNTLGLATIVIVALAFITCKKETPPNNSNSSEEVPLLPETPYDYPESGNDHLASLGRVLFYDKGLSANNNISCASCHQQSKAFTDNLQFSPGTDNLHTTRNTPSIFPKNGRLFWDGRSSSLQDLVLRPIRNKVEMNFDNIPYLVDKIASFDYYTDLFGKAFPRQARIDSNMLKTALAEFLRNFNFSNTRFSRSERGQERLSESEVVGKDIFFNKGQCSRCHHVQAGQFSSNSSGYGNTDESHNIGLDATTADDGVGAISHQERDRGAFMMPVLLNVEFTAPYMHDGRFKTLEEVVEHYDSGIKNHPGLDPILKQNSSQPLRLHLSDYERQGLVAFLRTLSDPSILTDEKFSDPFVKRIRQ